jgi:hypothetical protein
VQAQQLQAPMQKNNITVTREWKLHPQNHRVTDLSQRMTQMLNVTPM